MRVIAQSNQQRDGDVVKKGSILGTTSESSIVVGFLFCGDQPPHSRAHKKPREKEKKAMSTALEIAQPQSLDFDKDDKVCDPVRSPRALRHRQFKNLKTKKERKRKIIV